MMAYTDKGYGFLFEKQSLVPAVVQDDRTGEVLMLAYMNKESFGKTLETGKCTFWSRSREKLWCKGETSGHFQMVKRISYDCDCDTLLLRVEPLGPACHTGNRTCFYRDFPYFPKDSADGTVHPKDLNGKEDNK